MLELRDRFRQQVQMLHEPLEVVCAVVQVRKLPRHLPVTIGVGGRVRALFGELVISESEE